MARLFYSSPRKTLLQAPGVSALQSAGLQQHRPDPSASGGHPSPISDANPRHQLAVNSIRSCITFLQALPSSEIAWARHFRLHWKGAESMHSIRMWMTRELGLPELGDPHRQGETSHRIKLWPHAVQIVGDGRVIFF